MRVAAGKAVLCGMAADVAALLQSVFAADDVGAAAAAVLKPVLKSMPLVCSTQGRAAADWQVPAEEDQR